MEKALLELQNKSCFAYGTDNIANESINKMD